MTDELIRPHDPFSGHEEPSAAEETTRSPKPAEPPAPPAEPEQKAAAKRAPVRRGRRPRKVPTDAEVAEAAKRVRK